MSEFLECQLSSVFPGTCRNGELTARHTHVVIVNGKHLRQGCAGQVGAGTEQPVLCYGQKGGTETEARGRNKPYCRLPCLHCSIAPGNIQNLSSLQVSLLWRDLSVESLPCAWHGVHR